MKTTIKLLAIAAMLIIPTTLVLSYDAQSTNNLTITITTFNSPQLYLLPSGSTLSSITIIHHEYQKESSVKPVTTFHTQSSPTTHTPNKIYSSIYEHTLLKKGSLDLVRILVPSTYYDTTHAYTTTSITLRLNLQEIQKSLVSQKDLSKYRLLIENPSVLDGYDSYSPCGPQTSPPYIIITNETLWSTFHNNFKDWKISTDPKINAISIVNLSYITTNPDWSVNGTYGDATNVSNGNPWIPDGKEIHSNYELFNDTQAKIRNYIRFIQSDNCKYVLLGGNKDIIPPRMAAARASGNGCVSFDNDMSFASDMYYSNLHFCMNNNTNSYWMENPCCTYEFDEVDWGFDICVGRVPVDSIEELNLWINKTKAYVNGNSQGNYLQSHICAAKNGANSITNDTWLDLGAEYSASISRQTLPITNISFVHNQNISDAKWQVMYNYVNGSISGYDGIHLILQAGHGDYLSGRLWDYYRPDYCGNSLNPNFVYSESCKVGAFGTTTSTCTEEWMSDNGCMVAGITNSAFGWFGASTYFVEEFLRQIYNQTLGNYTYTFCAAHNAARENEGYTTADGVWAMIYKETNFFGDPALEYNWCTQSIGYLVNDSTYDSVLSDNTRHITRTSDGSLHAVYLTNTSTHNDVWYAKSTDAGLTWTNTMISPNLTLDKYTPSIAVDNANHLHVVWAEGSTTVNRQLRYRKYNGNSWLPVINLTNNLTNVYYQPNLAISDTDIHIVHETDANPHNNKFNIWYLEYTNNSWQTPYQITNESTYSIKQPAISIDNNNFLHVVCRASGGASNYDIKYINKTTTWSTLITIGNDTSMIEWQASPTITIDTNNNIHVAWIAFNGTFNQYRFIRYRNHTTQWNEIINITNTANEPFSSLPSLSVDKENTIHLLFYGNFTGQPIFQLRYINHSASGWSSKTNLTTSINYQYRPHPINANHPSFIKPNKGYSILFMENSSYDIRFYPSYDLEQDEIQIISINNQANATTIYDSTPTFVWTLIPTTSQYNLQISTTSDFSSLIINLTNINYYNYPSHYTENPTNISFTLPASNSLPTTNTYYCQVKAYIRGI